MYSLSGVGMKDKGAVRACADVAFLDCIILEHILHLGSVSDPSFQDFRCAFDTLFRLFAIYSQRR